MLLLLEKAKHGLHALRGLQEFLSLLRRLLNLHL